MRHLGILFMLTAAALFNLVTAAPASAGEIGDEDVIELGEIVFTATKYPHLLENVPVETVVITEQDIENSNAQNVFDLLKYTPGVYITADNVPRGYGWQSKMRGMTFDSGYALVLVNGERVRGGGMGEYGIGLDQIPINMIERIEIVKGPSSVLYGSDAMTGVVNIITKSAPEDRFSEFRLSCGTRNSFISSFTHGDRERKLGYLFSRARKEYESSGDGDEYEADHTTAQFDYRFKEDEKIGLGIIEDNLMRSGNRAEDKTRISIGYEREFPDGSLAVKGYFYRWDIGAYAAGAYSARFGNITDNQLSIQYNNRFSEKHMFTAGAERQREVLDMDIVTGNSLTYADNVRTIKSVYIQDEITLGTSATVLLGARQDDYTGFGTEFNPRIGVLFHLTDDTRVRAAVGRAFKSPTIRQLYIPFRHGSWWNTPNANLEAEKSTGFSLAVEQLFSDKLVGNLSLFRNSFKDTITYVYTGNTITIDGTQLKERSWQNVEKAYTEGLEFQIKYKASKNFSLNVGYTRTDAKNRDTDKKITYVPPHEASLTLTRRWGKAGFALTLGTRYQGSAFTDANNTIKTNDFYATDLKITAELSSKTRLFVDANNIFNSDFGTSGREKGASFLTGVIVKY
ncbi:MAG: TonB-dependent receptor [bacterium]